MFVPLHIKNIRLLGTLNRIFFLFNQNDWRCETSKFFSVILGAMHVMTTFQLSLSLLFIAVLD